jgi:hypothetical protein
MCERDEDSWPNAAPRWKIVMACAHCKAMDLQMPHHHPPHQVELDQNLTPISAQVCDIKWLALSQVYAARCPQSDSKIGKWIHIRLKIQSERIQNFMQVLGDIEWKDLNYSWLVAISTWTSARAYYFSKCRFASLHLQKNRGSMSKKKLAFYNNNSCTIS